MNAPLPPSLPRRSQLLMPMRLKVDVRVTVSVPGAGELTCTAEKLSRHELIVACGPETVRQMLPEGSLGLGSDTVLAVSFSLPDESAGSLGADMMRCLSHAVAVRRVARERFLVHLRFMPLPLHQAARLEQFIDTRKPAAQVA